MILGSSCWVSLPPSITMPSCRVLVLLISTFTRSDGGLARLGLV